MKRLFSIFIALCCNVVLCAQTDYSNLDNWYYHPDKPFNVIGNYNLDIAVIDQDLMIDTTISFTNNSETNTGVDIFWVHPTQLTLPPSDPTNVPLEDQPYFIISASILAQGALLAKYGRFYAPRYQQATPASFLNPFYSDSLRASAIITAYNDIKAAFEFYLENQNNGNKFIIAGHSQGALLAGMLLRDLIDNDPVLRSQLITASLGGMPYFHAENGSYSGGQWEHIPLCTEIDQCECIHTWRSFKETQTIPAIVATLPVFNSVLADSGLVYRNVNTAQDWFVLDSLYYGSMASPLRYYIAPDGGYDLGGGANFIAFDGLYAARFKREGPTKAVLSVDYTGDDTDMRPNDLLPIESDPSFLFQGFHVKDYHIYIWALMEQIDAKISGCATTTATASYPDHLDFVNVYPNPNQGVFTIEITDDTAQSAAILLTDAVGRVVKSLDGKMKYQVELDASGVYFVLSGYGAKRVIVR